MQLQIIRFTLPDTQSIAKSNFSDLRKTAKQRGVVQQYFGYSVATKTTPIPKQRHEITWVIGWPNSSSPIDQQILLNDFHSLYKDGKATYLQLDIQDSQWPKYETAMQSPVCEFAIMRLAQASPLGDEAFDLSVEKSYTDCFRVQGFVGGDWGYCANTNEVSGDPITNSETAAPLLELADRRLVIYVLGWESAEIHEDYVRSPIFGEEMVTLGPWADQSSGAWYATFIKHVSEE